MPQSVAADGNFKKNKISEKMKKKKTKINDSTTSAAADYGFCLNANFTTSK
jgi:hypothetical protein